MAFINGVQYRNGQPTGQTRQGIVQSAMAAKANLANTWTPDQGFQVAGLDRAMRDDPALASRVQAAYTKQFNGLSGAQQYNFYNATRQIGQQFGTQLGINNNWINAYGSSGTKGDNGQIIDDVNNPATQGAQLTPGQQYGTVRTTPVGSGPGGGTGLGASLTSQGTTVTPNGQQQIGGQNLTVGADGTYQLNGASTTVKAPVNGAGVQGSLPNGQLDNQGNIGGGIVKSATNGAPPASTTPPTTTTPPPTTRVPRTTTPGATTPPPGTTPATTATPTGTPATTTTTPPGATPPPGNQPTSGIVNSAIGGPTAASVPNVDLSQGVNPNETVEGQLNQDLKANNPIIDQARQRAMQLANSRGLVNSSIAAQGGEEAAVGAAMDIAKQDAATYAQQSLANQDVAAKKYVNDTSNATQTNIANLNNAAALQRQQEQDKTTLANTGLNVDAQKYLQSAGFTHEDQVNLQQLQQTGMTNFSNGLNAIYASGMNPTDTQTAVSNYLSLWSGYPFLPADVIANIKKGVVPPGTTTTTPPPGTTTTPPPGTTTTPPPATTTPPPPPAGNNGGSGQQ